MIRRTIFRTVFLIFVVTSLSTQLLAVSETQIKAVFLEKFTHLIQWPENNNSEFVICILNDDNFAQTLKKVYAEKDFHTKKVNIISVLNPKDIPSCNLLFIGKNTRNAKKITSSYAKKPILTVSDHKGFISDNVMITIYLNKKRFNYIINNKVAQEANVKISYLLLKSAQEVIK